MKYLPATIYLCLNALVSIFVVLYVNKILNINENNYKTSMHLRFKKVNLTHRIVRKLTLLVIYMIRLNCSVISICTEMYYVIRFIRVNSSPHSTYLTFLSIMYMILL